MFEPDEIWEQFDDDEIVVPEQKLTAVYFNPAGQVVIRQQSHDDYDPFVLIPPSRLPALISKLQAMVPPPAKGRRK